MKKRSNSIEYQKSLHTSPGVHPDANRDDSKKEWAIGVKKNKFTKDRIFPTNTPTTDPSKGLPKEGIGKGIYRIKADNPSFEGSYWFHSDNFNDDETNKRPLHPEPDYLNPNDLHTGDDYVEIHGVIHPSERIDYNINNNTDNENYDEFGNPYLDKKNASHLIGISNISTNLNVQESKISKNNDIYTIKEQYKHIYKENKKNMKPNVKEQINRINQMIMFKEGMSYNDVKLLTEENIESGDGGTVTLGAAGVADGGDIAAVDGGDIAAVSVGDITAKTLDGETVRATVDGGTTEMVSGPIPAEKGDTLYTFTDTKLDGDSVNNVYDMTKAQSLSLMYSSQPQYEGQQPMYQVPTQDGSIQYSSEPQFEGQQPMYQVMTQVPVYDPNLDYTEEVRQTIQQYSSEPQFEGQQPVYPVTNEFGKIQYYSDTPQFEGQQPMYQVMSYEPLPDPLEPPTNPYDGLTLDQANSQLSEKKLTLQKYESDVKNYEEFYGVDSEEVKSTKSLISKVQSDISYLEQLIAELEKGDGGPDGPDGPDGPGGDVVNLEDVIDDPITFSVEEDGKPAAIFLATPEQELELYTGDDSFYEFKGGDEELSVIAFNDKASPVPILGINSKYQDVFEKVLANSDIDDYSKVSFENKESEIRGQKIKGDGLKYTLYSISNIQNLNPESINGILKGISDGKKETARVTKSFVKGGASKRGSYTAPSYGPTSLGANSLAFGTAKSAYNPFGGSETGKFSAGKTANLSRGVRGQLKDMSKAELLNVINQLSDNQESDNQEKEELNESRKSNKKMIRLTEADLYKIVDRVIREKKKF